jgi:predicted dehydrogenase
MRPMIDEFAAAVARGVADRATPRDGTVSLAICRAIETAIASGQAQDIAPLR